MQSRCIVKGKAQKSPLFWRFSGDFWFSQDDPLGVRPRVGNGDDKQGLRSRPGKPNQKKGQNETGMSLRKVHELTFFWFGLPGPLLKQGRGNRPPIDDTDPIRKCSIVHTDLQSPAESLQNREGVNREKLTVKKIINKEMFFFHRLCPLQTVKNRRKPWKNRRQTVKKSAPKIHHLFNVSFSPFTSSWQKSRYGISVSTPDLLFLAFLEMARKNTKKSRILKSLPNPLNPLARKEEDSKRQGIPRKAKSKEIQKGKEKKIRDRISSIRTPNADAVSADRDS